MSRKKKEDDRVEADLIIDATSGTNQETGPKEIPIGNGEGEETAVEENTDPVEQLESQVAELKDQNLLALADLDNYRKRMARQFQEVVRSANDRLLGELLEVMDNFERAMEHNGDNGATGATDEIEALRRGTELIYNQLKDLLGRQDVKPIEAVGAVFDPNLHEALLEVDSDDVESGVVVAEIQKGYQIAERVLRHSRVSVSKGKADPKESDAE